MPERVPAAPSVSSPSRRWHTDYRTSCRPCQLLRPRGSRRTPTKACRCWVPCIVTPVRTGVARSVRGTASLATTSTSTCHHSNNTAATTTVCRTSPMSRRRSTPRLAASIRTRTRSQPIDCLTTISTASQCITRTQPGTRRAIR